MKVGQAVFQNYGGMRRYGVVEKTIIKDRWLHLEIKWFNDQVYEASMDYLSSLSGGTDFTKYQYRIDEVQRVDAVREIDTLNEILNYQMSKAI